jgi:hypothetical protein
VVAFEVICSSSTSIYHGHRRSLWTKAIYTCPAPINPNTRAEISRLLALFKRILKICFRRGETGKSFRYTLGGFSVCRRRGGGFFYIRGSVHRNCRLKESNEMQQYEDVYLLLNYSTCFGRPSPPTSGIHTTVVAASGTDHTIWGASFLKRDKIFGVCRVI